MNKLNVQKQIQVLSCLCDGVWIRPTSRITHVAKGTILRLIESAGTVCTEYQDQVLRNLPCSRLQADEFWSFIFGTEHHAEGSRSLAVVQLGSACCQIRLMVASQAGAPLSWYLVSIRSGSMATTFHPLPGWNAALSSS